MDAKVSQNDNVGEGGAYRGYKFRRLRIKKRLSWGVREFGFSHLKARHTKDRKSASVSGFKIKQSV